MQNTDPAIMTYGQLTDMVERIEQIPTLSGAGAPTTTTPAFYLGQAYLDTTNNKVYFCAEMPDLDESGEVGNYTWVETGVTYIAGDNITISGTTISATDTTYTAGINVSISSGNVISATDTTYTAGTGISISGTTISADITVDSALSASSTNPVQNAVITAAIGDVETILNTLTSGSGAEEES